MTTTTTQATKYIACPECGSAAELYIEPSMWAGIWQCTNDICGVSDTCEHDNYTSEAIEVDVMGTNGERDGAPAIVDICDDCGTTLEPNTDEYGDDGDYDD